MSADIHPSAASHAPRSRSIPDDPRSGRWSGRKVECGIHIQAAPATNSLVILSRSEGAGFSMPYLIGFIIALFITLTGVGAGTITVPILVLFLGVPAPVAVAIGLMFAAAVKLILVPAQIVRGNVAWRTLGYMLLGGDSGRTHRLAVSQAPGDGRLGERDQRYSRHHPRGHVSLADSLLFPDQ